MEKTTNLMEPCCVDRRLPALLKENKGTAQFFTMGDVTLSKIYNAIAYMSGSDTVTIVAPAVTTDHLRQVLRWIQRGWTATLRLLVNDDPTATVQSVFGTDADTDAVTVAVDAAPLPSLLILEGKGGTLVVSGPLLTRTAAGLYVYSADYRREDRSDLVKAVDARINRHRVASLTS